jgi:class 3 adenylate cyclase
VVREHRVGGVAQQHGGPAAPASQRPPGEQAPARGQRDGADGLLATFDAPGQAIRCAAAVLAEGAAAGLQLRAGIHTGEVDLVGEDIDGASVQITGTVAALARPREILVSRTVRDLVAGSGITCAARGRYLLAAPAEEWPLFAVTDITI